MRVSFFIVERCTLPMRYRCNNLKYYDFKEENTMKKISHITINTGHVAQYEDEVVNTICENMQKAYEKEGIKVEILVDILKNADSMERLVNVGNAVLVEKAGKAHCMDIKEEIELLQRQDIKILGGIIVA